MEGVHNPDRFMGDLRQILSQGRKRIGLLVGAGAPLSVRLDDDGKLSVSGKPLIPGVEELTTAAVSGLAEEKSVALKAISEDLGNSANIETILSHVRLLQTALGKTKVNGLDGEGYKALGQDICAGIAKIVSVDLPLSRSPYHEIVSWIGGTQRAHAVEIFTTNYDLLFEQAFEAANAPYFDGFTGGHAPFFDPVTVAGNDLPPRWSRIWKLHGSLGWKIANQVVIRTGNRESADLVYPDHLKYDLTQKQPYSALFERLKQFLLTPDTVLLSIGFSFRDAHISAVVGEALAMNSNAAVLAFQYQTLANEGPARKLAFEHPNLSVYASDAAVIGGVEGAWRPGDLPKNWGEIRASFWGSRKKDEAQSFLLGDFGRFCRFCALSSSADISLPVPVAPSDEYLVEE